MKLALIGGDVSRSLSGEMHAFIMERLGHTCTYAHISVRGEQLNETVARLLEDCDGFNVTVPYKLAVMPCLREIRGDAEKFGAVNTVLCRTRTGYNTDGSGFMLMLKGAGIETAGRRVLVLGAGGAARSAVWRLKEGGADVSVYNRTRERAERLAGESGARLAERADEPCDVLVNTTSCGMGAQEGVLPCPAEAAERAEALVDLVYNPPQTAFLAAGARAGRRTVNGHAMLFYQAYYADCLYLGASPDERAAIALYEEYRKGAQR